MKKTGVKKAGNTEHEALRREVDMLRRLLIATVKASNGPVVLTAALVDSVGEQDQMNVSRNTATDQPIYILTHLLLAPIPEKKK